MSASPRPPIPSLIPESAPFTPEQRTWLNGLFAGLFGLSENVTPVSNADAARLLAGLLDGAASAPSAGFRGAHATERAWSFLAVLSGAAAMARAVKDDRLRREILDAARTAAKAL